MQADGRALDQLVRSLSVAQRLDEVQRIVRSAPRRVVLAGGGTLVLREGDQCFYADEDATSPLWMGQRFPVSQCISGWAMLNEQTAVVPDVFADERIPQEAYKPKFVRSLVMVPIGHPPIAAMGAYWCDVYEPSSAQVDALERLADAAAAAIDRIGFEHAPTTPVFNPTRSAGSRHRRS